MRESKMFFIGFSRNHKIGSYLVRIFQGWTLFSHTYIKFWDSYYEEWLVFEASHGEVHLITYENWKEHNTEVASIEVEMSHDEKHHFMRLAFSLLQVRYSILNIIGIFLRRVTGIKFFNDNRKGYICSELVAYALKNKYDFKKDLDYITPLDIYKAVI